MLNDKKLLGDMVLLGEYESDYNEVFFRNVKLKSVTLGLRSNKVMKIGLVNRDSVNVTRVYYGNTRK